MSPVRRVAALVHRVHRAALVLLHKSLSKVAVGPVLPPELLLRRRALQNRQRVAVRVQRVVRRLDLLDYVLPAQAHNSQPDDDFSGELGRSEIGPYNRLVCKNQRLFVANCEHRKYGQIEEYLDF